MYFRPTKTNGEINLRVIQWLENVPSISLGASLCSPSVTSLESQPHTKLLLVWFQQVQVGRLAISERLVRVMEVWFSETCNVL
jgi:hypothetical protein